ncbi:MAG: bifunctional 2-polyprenyl-6-hydroxyphenol methylase/3-demethylubiquinol 3-O-methyltransferase UbiG [Gammaproteobacteria bacterium]|nr:bifunctional 2-polyprenyl-6-hydroxyphenol methylase/3-demethylubiquinol 3-O-methyltransferase UbiG [Gammaproteobacteria bacterium]
MSTRSNVDPAELDKFQALASRWWDPHSEFAPLHQINPLRVDYIDRHCGGLDGKRVLDIGCGGGLLCEAMASRGARVTGIDLAEKSLQVARLHLHESGLEVDYQHTSAEDFAAGSATRYDVVTCLEMLEHVPDPGSIVHAAATLLKPGGRLLLSTINRNPKAFALAIVGAEYLLRLLPRGTHTYRRFIKPSELARSLRAEGMHIEDLTGMTYDPLTRSYALAADIDVNYLLSAAFDD